MTLKRRDVVVTGIPRSGTTLTAALIDRLPDTVCLNEPGWQVARVAKDAAGFARWLKDDFDTLRVRLLKGEPVPDRRAGDGAAVTNYYRSEKDGAMRDNFRIIPFTRAGLSPHFTLAVKHNGPYLAVLPELIKLGAFTIIAVIRHPVEVIHSWRSLDLPVSRGELPNAVPNWPELAQIVARDMDLLEKQVRIYDLMCKRLNEYRDKIHLLPYEALVKSPALVSGYLGVKGDPDDSLIGKPSREVPAAEREKISAALTAYGAHYAQFYPL